MSGVPVPVRRGVRAGGFVAITGAMARSPFPPAPRAHAPRGSNERSRPLGAEVERDALLALFAVQVQAHTPGGRGRGRGRLVVANHRAAIDVALLLRTFGGRMVSRADLSSRLRSSGPPPGRRGRSSHDRPERAQRREHDPRDPGTPSRGRPPVCSLSGGDDVRGGCRPPFHAGARSSRGAPERASRDRAGRNRLPAEAPRRRSSASHS